MTAELLVDSLAASPRTAASSKSALKIIYVLGSLRDGGTERQVLELLRHLDRNLFEPSLILMEGSNVERARNLVEHCFVLGVPQGGNSRWLSRSASMAKAVMRAQAHMKRLRSDIVHAFLPGPSILGGLAARLAHVPLIIGSRRSLPSQYRAGRRTAGWADTAAFRLAHFNLGNSIAVTEEMIRVAGCPTSKCATLHNGVDLQRFHPDVSSTIRQHMGWTQDEIVFGQIANFRPGKRHADFVEMSAILAPKHPRARFILAGADYGTQPSIARQIEARGLGSKIKVLNGGPSPEEVFAALDVYVCTSEAEGFSNVILEAMACAKPVIATAVGGNPEAVRNEHSGFLVRVGDIGALSQRAETLLEDASLRKRMGTQGRQLAETEFSLTAMVTFQQAMYRSLFDARLRRVQ
jgi:glycosyltransferase involved in cell wall biosynthesis